MRLDIGTRSDIGRRKKTNEDNYGVYGEDTPGLKLFQEGALLCVADGLGGHIGGEIASKLAISVFKDMLKEPRPPQSEAPDKPDKNLHELLRDWVGLANDNIYQTNLDLVKNGRPMGTTLLAALVEPEKVHVVNVGDSRCYHIRDGEIIARTQDHSWVDEQVKLGMMSKEAAEIDRRRNLVTRSLGTHPEVDCDTYLWHITSEDVLLLCTDGLVKMVEDAHIRAELDAGGTAADIAQRLVDRANENGGRDNITVVVAHIDPKPAKMAVRRTGAWLRKHGKPTLVALSFLLFGVACFAAGYFARSLMLR